MGLGFDESKTQTQYELPFLTIIVEFVFKEKYLPMIVNGVYLIPIINNSWVQLNRSCEKW